MAEDKDSIRVEIYDESYVNGDTSAVVSGTATLTTAATAASGAGTYPITFSTEKLAILIEFQISLVSRTIRERYRAQTDGMRRAGPQRDALSSQVIDVLEGTRRRPAVKKLTTKGICRNGKLQDQQLTIGLDLGDRSSFCCVLNGAGDVVVEQKVSTTPDAMKKTFEKMARSRIALETGTHSPWVSRLLSELGHEVIVAHARNVRLIGESRRKDDRMDAQTLARLARIDPQLLSPIRHRSAQAQADLSVIRARHALVRARTALVCAARGLTKSFGERIRGRNPKGFKLATGEALSPQLQVALAPLLSALEAINEQIREYNVQIEKLADQSYPEVALLKQIKGVGTLIALTYMLTLEDPKRFRKSRDAGCYVGLQPGRRNSGQSEPQLHITKEGDSYLRMVLLQGAHHILGPFGEDSDLRRWGLKLAERGGKNGKKRATVAVARKLAVLLHHLWISGEEYEPLHNTQKRTLAAA